MIAEDVLADASNEATYEEFVDEAEMTVYSKGEGNCRLKYEADGQKMEAVLTKK